MSHLDTGVYGAKRQTFHSVSPRSILLEIVEKYPNESEEKLFEIAFEKLSERPGGLRAVAEYWFANEYRRLSRPAPVTPHSARVARAAETIKAGIQQHIDRRVQIVLSEMLMPSGVALRDSDREECSRAGGWFTKIAERLAPGQRVSEVFSEESLRQLYLGGTTISAAKGAR